MTPKRRLMSTLAAAATALGLMTAAALPARASETSDDVAKLLAGIAVLAILAETMDKDDAPKTPAYRPMPEVRPDHPRPHHPRPGTGHDDRWTHRPIPGDHDRWDRPARPPKPVVTVEPQMPRVCRMEIDGLRGERRAYGETCLRAHGITGKLPRHCATDVRIKGRWDRVYGANCMADIGVYGRNKRRN